MNSQKVDTLYINYALFSLSPGNRSEAVKETQMQFQVLFLTYFGFAIVFLASLFGNSVIIHIIRTDSSMKTTINHLILNQACADMLITLVQLMNTIHYSSYNRLWFGGLIGLITCKLFLTSFFILPNFSIWILVAIAVDRFYAVTQPLRRSPISRNLKKAIVIMCAWSIASVTGILVNVRVEKAKESSYCDLGILIRTWTQFNVSSLVLNVFLPLLVIIALYTIICVKLWSHEVPGDGNNQNRRQAEAIKTARKVTQMTIAVVVFFLLCWLPFLVLTSLQLFGYVKAGYSLLLFPAWLTAAFSGLNPYVYFTFSANFRNSFKRSFRNCYFLPFRSQSVELQQM